VKQKAITLVTIVLIALLMSLVVVGSNNKEKKVAMEKIEALKSGDPILYFGETCPHCKDVEEWLVQNKVEEQLKIVKKEVWNDRQNAGELAKVAQSCGLDTSSIGVPFLYAEEKCMVGTPEITGYFSSKLDLDSQTQEASQAGLSPEGTPSAISN
jgi:glutaredoxin